MRRLASDLAAFALVDTIFKTVERENKRRQCSDPARQLGLALVRSVRGQVAELGVQRILRSIAAENPGWCLARSVDPGERVGDVDHVLATGSHLVCVETKASWRGQEQLDQAARAAKALGKSYPDTPWVSILCVEELSGQELRYATDGNGVYRCGPDELTTVIHSFIRSDATFEPEQAPLLTKRLNDALQFETLCEDSFSSCLKSLPGNEWVIATDFHAFEQGRPVPLIAAGPKGVFVCEPVVSSEANAADLAAQTCKRLAEMLSQISCECIPVILQPSGFPREIVTTRDRHTVWSVSGDDLGSAISDSKPRHGIGRQVVDQILQPLPGSQYWAKWDPSGQDWQIGYTLGQT